MHKSTLSLSNWPEYISSALFRQVDGFFEIPYFSNSGKVMRDSIIALNPAEHNPEMQYISCDNKVLKGCVHYREITEGLYLFATEIEVKENIISKTLYDDTLKADHYFLSLAVFTYYYPVDSISESFVSLCSITNTFHQPKTKVANYFYKGSNGIFLNIGFTKSWALQNLALSDIDNKKLSKFLEKGTGLMNWLEVMPDSVSLVELVWKIVKALEKRLVVEQSLFTIITETIRHFFKEAMLDSRFDNFGGLLENDYVKLAKAEQIILRNLNKPFPGVDYIADLVEMSATKLKASFKLVYGFSMLQYHKERNMRLAYQLIQNSDTQIKYVTELVGFNSVSKFSAAFKKRFNILPSAARKKTA